MDGLKKVVFLMGFICLIRAQSDPQRVVQVPVGQSFGTGQLFPFAVPFGNGQRLIQVQGTPQNEVSSPGAGSPEILENPSGITHIYKHIYVHITPPLFLENANPSTPVSSSTLEATTTPRSSTTTSTTPSTTTTPRSKTKATTIPPRIPKEVMRNKYKDMAQQAPVNAPVKIYIKTRSTIPYSFNDMDVPPNNFARQLPEVVLV